MTRKGYEGYIVKAEHLSRLQLHCAMSLAMISSHLLQR